MRTSADLRAEDAPKGGARMLLLTQSAGFQARLGVTQGWAALAGRAGDDRPGRCQQPVPRRLLRRTPRDFTKEQLDNYDIVFFYTTGDLPIKDEVRDYFFNEWLKKKGHGFIGAHSAADTYHNYEPYWDMIGGTFNGHPWGSDQNGHRDGARQGPPAQQAVGRRVRDQDEIYHFKNWQPEKVRVLMSLNMAKTELEEAVPRADRLGEELRRRQGACT